MWCGFLFVVFFLFCCSGGGIWFEFVELVAAKTNRETKRDTRENRSVRDIERERERERKREVCGAQEVQQRSAVCKLWRDRKVGEGLE